MDHLDGSVTAPAPLPPGALPAAVRAIIEAATDFGHGDGPEVIVCGRAEALAALPRQRLHRRRLLLLRLRGRDRDGGGMKGDGTATHLEVRGLFRPDHGQPACGKWSQRVTADPALVTCEDCKATLDFVMAGGERQ